MESNFSEKTAFAQLQASSQEAKDFFKNHPQAMTLDALLKAGLPVYVKNNVSKAGRIAVDFTINGVKRAVEVPNTWISVCLNDRMSASDISTSGSLRDMLRKGVLILTHPDVAEAEYSTARGQRELSKMRSSLAKANESEPTIRAVPTGDVSDRMKAYVIEYLEADDADDRTAVGDSIFGSARTFSQNDVDYFTSKASGTPEGQKLAQELREFLANRT